MASSLLIIAAVITMANAQCGPPDDARCTSWVQGGFCTSNFYTLDYRKATCGAVCNLCPTTPAAACAGTTEKANCGNWKTNQPCLHGCAETACGAIYDPAGAITVNTGSTAISGMMPMPVPTISKIFVKSGCTMKLYNGALAPARGSPFRGADNFSTLAGDATTAIAYECTCP